MLATGWLYRLAAGRIQNYFAGSFATAMIRRSRSICCEMLSSWRPTELDAFELVESWKIPHPQSFGEWVLDRANNFDADLSILFNRLAPHINGAKLGIRLLQRRRSLRSKPQGLFGYRTLHRVHGICIALRCKA
jgi:hypothetical protein